MPEPYPENVDGDFYVESGCCTCCDVPLVEAPTLFKYSDSVSDLMHCYVSKQPSNPLELEAMLRVIHCAELKCIRYRGEDAKGFLAETGVDVDSVAEQIDGRFMSAFVRAVKPA